MLCGGAGWAESKTTWTTKRSAAWQSENYVQFMISLRCYLINHDMAAVGD